MWKENIVYFLFDRERETQEGKGEKKTDEPRKSRLVLWNALALLQVLLMKKSDPRSVLASPPSDTLGSAFSLPCLHLPPPLGLVIAFCIIVSISINKTSQCISLSRALYNDNIYRGSSKICIERLIVNMQ